jgi:Mlc titration factor MtfA (ptsG expression regulator)
VAFPIILAVALAFLGWLVAEPLLARWRRRRIGRQPFPAAWRAILRQRVPHVRALPADLQVQVKRHVLVFLAAKEFVGCDGFVITDEVRVTIAAQACLLLLNRRTGYFPNLRRILVYPGAFVVDRAHTDAAGVLHPQRRVLSGESWSQGQVILSWADVLAGAQEAGDGRNLVIHEFAHQLDQEDGRANGAPRLARREQYPAWSQVFEAEYAKLRAHAAVDAETLLDHYGASDPAEFFAVVSEVFFEQPRRLAAEHCALYRELARYYRVDPLCW